MRAFTIQFALDIFVSAKKTLRVESHLETYIYTYVCHKCKLTQYGNAHLNLPCWHLCHSHVSGSTNWKETHRIDHAIIVNIFNFMRIQI